MLTRGSGEYGSQRQWNFDDARIRECGSGRQNRYIWWRVDPGLRIRASHLFLETCTLIFISGFMPDAWIQKHVVVSVKSQVPYHIVPFRSLYYILFWSLGTVTLFLILVPVLFEYRYRIFCFNTGFVFFCFNTGTVFFVLIPVPYFLF